MSRRVSQLEWAARLEERPKNIPVGRPRGAKLEGCRYERRVAAALSFAEAGAWWQFRDRDGPGVCQTDLVIHGMRSNLVLEVKYGWTAEAWEQLEGLYLPVLALALKKPTIGVQICRVLRDGCDDEVVSCLQEAIDLAKRGRRVTLHWAEAAPLWPRISPGRRTVVGAFGQSWATP